MADMRAWQERLDREFPDGAIASWVEDPIPDSPAAIFSIPRIIVVGMNGDFPIITMPTAPADGKVLDNMVVTSWNEYATQPHLIVIANLLNDSLPLRLCAAVTPQMAKLMAPLRKEYMTPGLYP